MALNEKFGRNRSNVRKVKLPVAPDMQMLQRLLSDLSMSSVGAECDVTWQSGRQFYTLTLTHSRQAVRANWKLYRGQGTDPKLVWEHATNDVTVVDKSILADIEQCKKPIPTQSTQLTARTPAGTEERRAINLNKSLTAKLRHLFIGAQDDLITGTSHEVIAQEKFPVAANPFSVLEYVDLTAGRELLQQLFVNEYGVFSYPTFLFFLEREYYEAVENNAEISLVVFNAIETATRQAQSGSNLLMTTAFVEVAKRLKQTQRKTDILAQYEHNKFAVLLPDTNAAGGKAFVRRVEKALLKTALAPELSERAFRFVFGISTLGEHCKTLPSLLAFADKALETAQQLGSNFISGQDILTEQSFSGYEYLSKSIDLGPTQQLVSQLVSGGIFTFPTFLAFLEHEYYRSARKKRELRVLLLKVRVYEETFDEPENMLPASASYELIRRVSGLLSKRDVFAHYPDGNFVILRSNTSALQMDNFSKRALQEIMKEDWLTPECPATSLRILAQTCIVQPHETNSNLLGFVPAT
jgi:Diguanylate cyclase, GGDEF domain